MLYLVSRIQVCSIFLPLVQFHHLTRFFFKFESVQLRKGRHKAKAHMNSTCCVSHGCTCMCACPCKLRISKTRGRLVIAETPSPLFKILSESWLLRVVHRPAAPASPGSLLESQNFKLLLQTYCIRNCMLISSPESCTSTLRNADIKTMTQIPDPGSKVLVLTT